MTEQTTNFNDFSFDVKEKKNRYLILNDTAQDMPKERLKIVGGGTRLGKTSGAPYKWILLRGEDGDEYECSTWERDVTACAREWGNKPSDWGFVKLQLNKARTAYEIVPHEYQLPEEEAVL